VLERGEGRVSVVEKKNRTKNEEVSCETALAENNFGHDKLGGSSGQGFPEGGRRDSTMPEQAYPGKKGCRI